MFETYDMPCVCVCVLNRILSLKSVGRNKKEDKGKGDKIVWEVKPANSGHLL